MMSDMLAVALSKVWADSTVNKKINGALHDTCQEFPTALSKDKTSSTVAKRFGGRICIQPVL